MATVSRDAPGCAICLAPGPPLSEALEFPGFRIEFCADCGGGRLRHRGDAPTEMLAPEIENRRRFRGFHERMARWRLGYLRERTQLGSLLEVGCATGEVLQAAREAGIHAIGLERCAVTRAEAARRYPGLDLRGEDPDAVEVPEGGVDAVVAFHVFEHVDAPEDFLLAARELLAPGGVVHLRVPHQGSAFAWLTGRSWPGYVPDHRWLFTPVGLRRLLKRCGFEILEVATNGYPGESMLLLAPLFWRLGGRTPGEWRRRWRGGPSSASRAGPGAARGHSHLSLRDRAHRASSWLLGPLLRCLEWTGLGEEIVVTARVVGR